MAELGASDLHLSVSMPPMIRKDGKMKPLHDGDAALTADAMRELLTSIMPARNQEEFAERNDTDFAYEIPGLARFRCNVFMDRKGMGAVFRIIPSKILTAEQLGLSKAIMDLCSLSKASSSSPGRPVRVNRRRCARWSIRSTNSREDHIITIEDPIEFVHDNQKCLVNQREVHNHTDSFKDALRAALREDPDIVLVGEMRDLETISIAIETAENGPPRFRHAAHDDRSVDRRPHHRSVPRRPPAADPRDAFRIAKGRHRPNAAAEKRRRPRRGSRGADRHTGHQQPDPRRQNIPDTVGHADR